MAGGKSHPVLRFLRRLVAAGPGGDPTDRQLLQRIAGHREEAAFAALVQRHGPMVLGVCRRILHDPHDADDLRTRLAGIRRRPGAPSTSTAAELAARFGGLPDPRAHPEPPLT